MQILENTDIAARGPNDPQAWYLFAEASRLMYADRDRYVGDPAFVKVPVAGLIDRAYARQRAALIGPTAGPPRPRATRSWRCSPAWMQPSSRPAPRTSSSATPRAMSSSMTTTVESIFGTGRMVDGFFLNNQLTDFSFSPTDDQGRPVANAVAAGKRPRSSMVPSILLTSDGRFAGAFGSAGGNAIIAYVAKNTGRRDRLERADGQGAGRAQPRRARAQLPGRGDGIFAAGSRRACVSAAST